MTAKWVIPNDILYLYGQYENEKRYNEVVVNKRTGQMEGNPRSRDQIELKKQFFAFYVVEEKTLYLSHVKQRGMLQDYIGNTLVIETEIKNIYKSIDEFVDSIEVLVGAEFVEHRRLTQDEQSKQIMQCCTDIYGLGVPNEVRIKLDLLTRTGLKLKSSMRKLNRRYQQDAIGDICFIGRDDKEIEHRFNLSSVIQTMTIDAEQNQDQRFIEVSVQQNFLTQLKRRGGNVFEA